MASRPQTSGDSSPPAIPSDRRNDIEPVVRRLFIDVVTVDVVRAFEREGIPCILLKGPALVRWLYPPGSGRSYVDTDLLVSPGDVPTAEGVIASMGFRRAGREAIPGDWPRHAHAWGRADGAMLDLHYTLPGARVPPTEVWNRVSRRVEPMMLRGISVDILDEGGRAVMVALHAFKDGGRVPQAREDLSLALKRVSPQVWRDAAAIASDLGAVDAFAAGLQRVKPGAELAERLDLPAYRSTSVALRVHGAPPLAVGLEWLLRSAGWKNKPILVVRKLFPPRRFLQDWSPLAARGRLGLAVARVWRPLWVLWHVGPAFRAWFRARRRSGPKSGRH